MTEDHFADFAGRAARGPGDDEREVGGEITVTRIARRLDLKGRQRPHRGRQRSRGDGAFRGLSDRRAEFLGEHA